MTKKKSLFGDRARSIELLWQIESSRERPNRGPKPGLSVERIAEAGVSIADADGLASVSMQRVAATFGFTTMSLYRYVPSKTELVDLMIDMAMGTAPRLDRATGWRTNLETWAGHLWGVYRMHPWLLGATVGHRVIGPNELGWMESALAALEGTPLDGAEKMDATFVVLGHVRNLAQQTLTTSTQEGTDEPRMLELLGELLLGRADRYPATARAVTSASTSALQNQGFEFGLARILDGLGYLIGRRSYS
ncbi:TetR/AcrR family transcriptional regulator [Pendulispora rubella]|uniref:TetR/AcrR family transcriptional regulator n=1 Tax=Pendulispora rubella TaxID=2741070 RepID=A0ABZ2L668_9BACT